MVKESAAMQELQEMQFWSIGGEDPLEEGMTTRSSILAWRIPWTEEPGELQSMESHRVGHNWSGWAHKGGLWSLEFILQLTLLWGTEHMPKSFPQLEIYLKW